MVTARELITVAESRGARFEVIGERLRATPRGAIDAALHDAIGAHKAEIIDELLRRKHDSAWPPPFRVCDFHFGRPGETCRRCSASWVEHYPAPPGTSIVTDASVGE